MFIIWLGFIGLILALLALDLGVFHRNSKAIGVKAALGWTVVWIVISLVFNVALYFMYERHWMGLGTSEGEVANGRQAALMYFTGYVVEKSLSLDNIFVIMLIVTYFRIPAHHQHRLLFWGILGALIMRGAMIGAGTALLNKFSWLDYVFGILLLATAVKLLFSGDHQPHPDRNLLVRLMRKFFWVTPHLDGRRFFTRWNGRRAMTPLSVALLTVESSDVMFAVDSIPAIFAITCDPFIVFTSNVFAILGLRSLYFALAAILDKFRYLRISLVFILAYVGVKMLLAHHFSVPTPVSLAVIVGILAVGVMASLVEPGEVASDLPPPSEGV